MTLRLAFETTVPATPEQVWSRVSTMPGVNSELMPILRMTYPARLSKLDGAPRELLGKLAFKSWVLLGGVLPIDRHFLSLASIKEGEGFDERSWSWSNRIWNHKRTLTPAASGTTIRDDLEFEPRLAIAAPFLRWFVSTVFRHRHRQLQKQFGIAA